MEDGIETTRTTADDGVRVRKTIDAGPEGAAVVHLEVALEREEPTTVRLAEPALGAVPRDEIELHTDHGAEYWQVGETATFEREFDAGETYEVVYRVTGVDEDRLDVLDADPVVAPADSAIDDLVDRDDSDAIRELIAGERESLAAAPVAGGVELSVEADADDSAGDVGDVGEPAADEPDVDPGVDPVDVDTGGDPVDVEVDSGYAEVDAEGAPDDAAVADPDAEPTTASSGGPAGEASQEEVPVEDSSEQMPVEESSGEIQVDDPSEEMSVGGPGDDDPADAGDDPATPDLEIEEGTEEASEEEAASDATDDATTADESPSADLGASLAATPSGGLARVLLRELREGHVDDETREALLEELGASEAGRSQDVRIKHLQSQVAEFSAYVEMLDGFVDEHGTFEAVLGEMSSLEEAVESVRSDLEGLADAVEDVEAATDGIDDLEAGQDHLRAGQEDLETGQEELNEGQDDLRQSQDDLAARVDRLEDELATVDERLDEFDEFKERLSGVFQSAGDSGT